MYRGTPDIPATEGGHSPHNPAPGRARAQAGHSVKARGNSDCHIIKLTLISNEL